MTNSRRDGYIIDVPYPLHFYKEMQPLWLTYMLSNVGCQAPDITSKYRYCELGCGAGINTLVAAACNPLGEFVGVDFNPEHIAIAREAASYAKIKNVTFIESSFENFSQQTIAPFDFIVTHGVWSWLSLDAKRSILKILDGKLKNHGIFYLQYMCFPGAARLISLQKILFELSLNHHSSSSHSAQQGLHLLRSLADAGAGLFTDNLEIEKELQSLEKEHPSYIAHDFLSENWNPEHSADVHRLFAQFGLSYIGSADCLENMDTLSIPRNVFPILSNIPSRPMKELVRDISRNQSQRMDIFQKNVSILEGNSHLSTLKKYQFKWIYPDTSKRIESFKTALGQISAPQPIIEPIVQSLQTSIQSFDELNQIDAIKDDPGLLLQSLNLLLSNQYISIIRPDRSESTSAQKLQEWLHSKNIPLRLQPDCGNAEMRT